MASSHNDNASSDEEDAPETISLSHSKHHIQQRDEELKKIQQTEKAKKKAENRARDQRLKERAEKNKGKQKQDDLEARMERAMREAQEEMDEDGSDDEEFEGFTGLGEEQGSEGSSSEGSINMEEEEESVEVKGSAAFSEEDEDMQSNEDEEGDDFEDADDEPRLVPKKNPLHLPDELFKAAFTSQTSATSKKKLKATGNGERLLKKTKRRSTTKNDLIIGTRAIRTLPSSEQPRTPSAMPSRKIKKFLDRTLSLKGGKTKTKAWERRPANIGVFRREGNPAANFVRNQSN